MVISVVKKRQFCVVTRVVTKGKFWKVLSVAKKRHF